MASRRTLLVTWAAGGALDPGRLREALAVSGALPDDRDWRRFIERLLVWSGSVALAMALLFFVAANWEGLGRFAKFGLVELPLAGCVALAVWLGPDRPGGRAAVSAAALLTGVLLALVGQTYQTGADPWQLFALWALLILPWAAVARVAALWLMVVLLLEIALVQFFHISRGFEGLLEADGPEFFGLLILNAAAQAAWELAALRLAWLRRRWGPRTLALLTGVLITLPVLFRIIEASSGHSAAGYLYLFWLAALAAVYYRLLPDLFMLAGGALSLVVTAAAWLGARGLEGADPGLRFLAVGLAVVAMSAASALWLRHAAREMSP